MVAIQQLRSQLIALGDPNLVPQTGSAALAIEMLYLPWRQRFQNTTLPTQNKGTGAFVSTYSVAKVITDQNVTQTVKGLV